MAVGLKIEGVEYNEGALEQRPEHAAILGRIFTSWSLIEGTISGLLGLMMHADPKAAMVVMNQFRGNHERVNAVRKIARELLAPPVREQFDELMKEVLNYARERNTIAHSLWGVNPAEQDLVYRLPMTAISSLLVQSPSYNWESAMADIDAIKTKEVALTTSDLKAIEDRGRKMLLEVMSKATQKAYKDALSQGNPNAKPMPHDTATSAPIEE